MRLFNKIRTLFTNGKNYFDPSTLDDPIAETTNWYSLANLDAGTKSRELNIVTQSRIEFSPSFSYKSWFWIITVVMMLLMSYAIIASLVIGRIGVKALFILMVSFIITCINYVIWHENSYTTTLDKDLDICYTSSAGSLLKSKSNRQANGFRLREIHALQLIEGKHRGNRRTGRFTLYEINMVLKNGERKHLINHDNILFINKTSEKLANFLAVPVWSAVGFDAQPSPGIDIL